MIAKHHRIADGAPLVCSEGEWAVRMGAVLAGRPLADELDFAYGIEFCSTGKGLHPGPGLLTVSAGLGNGVGFTKVSSCKRYHCPLAESRFGKGFSP